MTGPAVGRAFSVAKRAHITLITLESDWERSNHSKIRNVSGNAELGRDVEQGPGPHDCAEAHVDGA